MTGREGPEPSGRAHVSQSNRGVDGAGRHVAAGFIDLQVNGGWGHDFTSDPETIWRVGEILPRTGVTSFLPTIVSAPYPVVDEAIQVLTAGPPHGYRGAEPLGLHVEGPWISPQWRGAHDPRHLRPPDPETAARWASSGVVRMVTMAPELPGADEVAATLAEAGIVVSAGHSGADYETAAAALAGVWGAVTHLYNQMSQLRHREPGLVGAALDSERPCGIIVDGKHSHPAAVRIARGVLGPERLLLVTDSVAATGMGEGAYELGGRRLTAGERGVRDDEGALAGSTLTMDRAVANLVTMAGASEEDALASASATPALLLGLTDRGLLEPGRRADAVRLAPDLTVLETVIAGESVFRAGEGSP